MDPIRINPYTLIYIWLGVGFIAGIILFLIGWSKGRTKIGALGLLCSVVGGGILGIFLIVPVFAVFLWLILRSPREVSTPDAAADQSASEPAVADSSEPTIDES